MRCIDKMRCDWLSLEIPADDLSQCPYRDTYHPLLINQFLNIIHNNWFYALRFLPKLMIKVWNNQRLLPQKKRETLALPVSSLRSSNLPFHQNEQQRPHAMYINTRSRGCEQNEYTNMSIYCCKVFRWNCWSVRSFNERKPSAANAFSTISPTT